MFVIGCDLSAQELGPSVGDPEKSGTSHETTGFKKAAWFALLVRPAIAP